MERAIKFIGVFFLLLSCQKTPSPSSPPSPTPEVKPTEAVPQNLPPGGAPAVQFSTELIQAGKTTYTVNCTQCHNKDPRKDGALGPSIAGSSLELIEGRVLRLEYPPGYKPKRMTKKMLKMPHLKSKIPALHAYLNSL